jgi:hypothetical protein
MIRRLAAFTLAALAILLMPASAAAAASATWPAGAARGRPTVTIGIQLLQVPASERNDPRAYEYIIDRLSPRTTIQRRFQVSDRGNTAAQVAVYAAAASIGGGSFQFAPGNTQNEMTTWVRVSHPVLNLRPGQRTTEVVTIAVPAGATRGEQYGVIWAQVDQGGGQGNIKLVNRVGIRIYLSVGPGGAPPSNFTFGTPRAQRVDGHPVLRIPMEDTGGRAVDIFGTLSLAGGPGGLQAGPFRADSVVTLAPGQSGTMVFTLGTSLPDGPWQAQVTLQSGLIIRTGKFTVDFASLVQASSGFPVALTAGLAVAVAVLIVIAVLVIMWSRRPQDGDGSPGWA